MSVLLLIFGLLSADDSFIFCWTLLGEFFQAYSLASAHIFNYDKSSILFSPRVNSYARLVIKRIFGFHEVSTLDRYLGLAAMVGRQRKAFIFLHELQFRVEKKLLAGGNKHFHVGVKRFRSRRLLWHFRHTR